MNSRRNNQAYKQKRPLIAFGQLILPLSAVIAVGMLLVGVKLFFMTPSIPSTSVEENPSVSVAHHEEAQPSNEEVSSKTSPSREKVMSHKTPKQRIVAVPLVQASPISSSDSRKNLPALSPLGRGIRPTFSKGGEKVQSRGSEPERVLSPNAERSSSLEAKNPPLLKEQVEESTLKTQQRSSTSTKVATSQDKTAPSSLTLSNWGVQIGAFSQKEAAEALCQKVGKEGLKASVVQVTLDGRIFFRVRIYAGHDRSSAEALATELQAKGYPTLIVPLY